MRSFTPIVLTSNHLRVEVLPRGASLVGVYTTGSSRNLVLGFADPAHHAEVPVYAGALVGPVANRVARGEVLVEERLCRMPLNEGGVTCLHSGPEGLHARDWSVTEVSDTAVTLETTLPDGAIGLPGLRRITACYEVVADVLTLTITAETDRTTPINIAAHPYWNLDGSPDVSGHRLEVAATQYLPTDELNLPTGERRPVAGTPFDFRTAREVPLTPALDVNYCLSPTDREVPVAAARLCGSDGTLLEIATTAPGLQVYSGAHLPALAGVLTGGRDLQPYGALALEPQHWPDAPNHPDFPDILLRPGDTWHQKTCYKIVAPV